MFKIFKSEKSNNEEVVRPWVINQYDKLKLAKFSHKEILSVLDMNSKEIEYIKKQNFIIVNEKTVKSVKQNKETVKQNKETVKDNKETVKDNKEKVNEKTVKSVKQNKETVKDNKEKVKQNKETVKEDPSTWNDDVIIEKAINLLTKNMKNKDIEMAELLKESFNNDTRLVDLYRTKFKEEYEKNKNDNKSTENTEKVKKESVESKKEKESVKEEKEESKKVKTEDNKTDDFIDNETINMLTDDVYDQYCSIFNINKDALKNLIITVLKDKPEILKSNNYYFICMRLCEIIESLIMENTIEDNEEEEDEILKQLNSIVE